MADKHDEVTKLRADMSIAPKRPEFGSAVGGYNRTEVNRYLDEQNANAEALKRVTDRLRDRPGLTGTQRRDLIDITSNWPWTPAAWDAAAILGATPGLKHDEPAPAVKPAAGKP